MLNELRVQYARRHQFRTQGISVDGPAVTVTGKAAFRRRPHRRRQFRRVRLQPGHHAGHRQREPDSRQTCLQDRHRRAVDRGPSACVEISFSTTSRRSPPTSRPRAGPTRFAYSNFQQQLGDLSAKYNSGVLRALRAGRLADLVAGQAALPACATTCSTCRPRGRSRPNSYSQDFRIDKNNFGPRAGLSWSVDDAVAHGRACVGRPDVRAAAARFLRQRDPEQRRSEELQRGPGSARQPRALPLFPPAWRRRLRDSSCRSRASM